jgi:hypothetical protein
MLVPDHALSDRKYSSFLVNEDSHRVWAIKDRACANLEKYNSLFFRLITDSLPHFDLEPKHFF